MKLNKRFEKSDKYEKFLSSGLYDYCYNKSALRSIKLNKDIYICVLYDYNFYLWCSEDYPVINIKYDDYR